MNGKGAYKSVDGIVTEGIFENDNLVTTDWVEINIFLYQAK